MSIIGQSHANDIVLKDKLRQTIAKARVTNVIDGQTLVVNNTTVLNLPMLYIPMDDNGEHGDISVAAKTYLTETLQDRFIRVYQVRDRDVGRENALGHLEAYVERDDGLWIQKDMVDKGLAFVYPTEHHHEFTDELYAFEHDARMNKRGLWADERWAVVDDKQAAQVMDRYAIVEGKIVRVATKNNVIYLNFGKNWKDDFTIAIQSSNRRHFSKAGIRPMQLSGQKVRVRGWIREYNGPYVEAFHPSQIEILKNK